MRSPCTVYRSRLRSAGSLCASVLSRAARHRQRVRLQAGEDHDERASVSRRALDANHAAVQFDEALHECESEACALTASAGSLAELFEDDALLGGIDADA